MEGAEELEVGQRHRGGHVAVLQSCLAWRKRDSMEGWVDGGCEEMCVCVSAGGGGDGGGVVGGG